MKTIFNKLTLLAVSIVMMVATACSTDSATVEPQQESLGGAVIELADGRTLSFTATIASESRGSYQLTLDDYVIYGYNADWTENDGWFLDGAEMNYSNNEWHLTLPNDAVVVDAPKSGYSYFFSYSKQAIEDAGVTFVKDGESSYISYEMPEDPTNQPNLLMSDRIVKDANVESMQIAFAFEYALTSLGVRALPEGTGYYSVEKVVIGNIITDANITFAEDGSGLSTSNYTSLGEPTSITIDLGEGKGIANGYITDYDNGWFTLPAQPCAGVTLDITAPCYTDTSDTAGTRFVTLPSTTAALSIGTSRTFDITTDYIAPTEEITDVTYGGDSLEEDETEVYDYLLNVLVGEGETLAVSSNITSSSATTAVVAWKSSDDSVVTVDESTGKITGVAGGTAVITGTTETGTVITIFVTSYYPIVSYSTEYEEYDFEVGTVMNKVEYTVSYDAAAEGSDYKEEYAIKYVSKVDTIEEVISDVYTGYVASCVNMGSYFYINTPNVGKSVNTWKAVGSVSGYELPTTFTVNSYKVEEESSVDYNSIDIGAYLFSDGTFSDTYSSGVVGIVYYIDRTAGAEFGLAAAVDEVSCTAWCPASYTSTTTGATSLTDGLANTKTIIEKTGGYSNTAANNIAQSCYNKGTIADIYDEEAGKGQWYLPAYNELFLYYAARSGVYTATLSTISSVVPSGGYYSSTSCYFYTQLDKATTQTITQINVAVFTSSEYGSTTARRCSGNAPTYSTTSYIYKTGEVSSSYNPTNGYRPIIKF